MIHAAACCKSAPSCRGCAVQTLSRRSFVATLGAAGATGFGLSAKEPDRQQPIRTPLKVQPVLLFEIAKRREATSWRGWGGLLTEQDVAGEVERIGRELAGMAKGSDFPLELRRLEQVRTTEQAAAIAARDHDTAIVYAAGGGLRALEALTAPPKSGLVFVRHRSGPVYLWYEIAHPRYLRKTVDQYGQTGMGPDDVVVDSHAEVLWRLRSLAGLKNTLGKKIVAVGGPSGWGAGGRKAPDLARQYWKLDIQTVDYPSLGERIRRARQSDPLVRRSRDAAAKFLKQPGVKLETSRAFVENAFVLTEVFRDLLDEARTDAITINQCMGTIMPMSETTACLPLMLLNDEGYMAFCESDFVVIPSGILLHYVSGKPVFLNDPTYPHDGVVTIAHCTAPRRMDGRHDEPVRVMTHFESDYGAAPKVEMTRGNAMTNLVPDFDMKKWVGFEGKVVDTPFMHICRSQVDVTIQGDTRMLAQEMRGFHWMSCYGSYLRETGYALKKLNVDWLALA
jgi:hypothetical protein